MKIARTRLPLSLLTIPALGVMFSCAAPATNAVSYAVTEPSSVSLAEPTPVASNPTVKAPVVSELTLAPGPYQQYQPVPPPHMQAPRHQHGMLLIGMRELEDSAWKGMDQQFAMGFTFDKQIGDTGLAFDAGLHFSGDSTSRYIGTPPIYSKLSSDILEIDLGLLKMFYPGQPGEPGLRPYIGGGAAIAWTSARVYRFFYYDDTDFTPGLYGRAGLAFQHGSGALFGVDFRYLGLTDVNIAGFDTDIDGWVISLALGYGF